MFRLHLCVFVLALAANGCWLAAGVGGEQAPDDGDGTSTDADTDSDSDADGDGDSDADADNPFACEGEPVDCESIAETYQEQHQGCCYQNQACYCVYLPFQAKISSVCQAFKMRSCAS